MLATLNTLESADDYMSAVCVTMPSLHAFPSSLLSFHPACFFSSLLFFHESFFFSSLNNHLFLFLPTSLISLTSFLSFFLSFFLPFFLPFFLSFFLSFFLPSFLYFFLSSFLPSFSPIYLSIHIFSFFPYFLISSLTHTHTYYILSVQPSIESALNVLNTMELKNIRPDKGKNELSHFACTSSLFIFNSIINFFKSSLLPFFVYSRLIVSTFHSS